MTLTIRRISILALIAVVLTAGIFTTRTATAQTADPLIVCDSDLMLNLYIAEYYFNFDGIRTMLMNEGVYFNFMQAEGDTMLSLDSFDKGQYAMLFTALAAMPDTMMAGMMEDDTAAAMDTGIMEAVMMAPDAMADAMATMNATSMPDGDPDMVMIEPLSVLDEPAECGVLRAELTHFWEAVAYFTQMSAAGM